MGAGGTKPEGGCLVWQSRTVLQRKMKIWRKRQGCGHRRGGEDCHLREAYPLAGSSLAVCWGVRQKRARLAEICFAPRSRRAIRKMAVPDVMPEGDTESAHPRKFRPAGNFLAPGAPAAPTSARSGGGEVSVLVGAGAPGEIDSRGAIEGSTDRLAGIRRKPRKKTLPVDGCRAATLTGAESLAFVWVPQFSPGSARLGFCSANWLHCMTS